MRIPSPISLAKTSARRPWLTIAAWFALAIVAAVVTGAMLGGNLRSGGDLLNDPDSKRGSELVAKHMPQPNTELVLVTSQDFTVDDQEFRQYVSTLTEKLKTMQSSGVAAVLDYYEVESPALVSRDRTSLLVPVTLAGDRDEAQRDVPALREALASVSSHGFQSLLVGSSSVGYDFAEAAKEDLAQGESIGLALALVVLLVVFGTIAAAALPIALALVAILLALAATALLGEAVTMSVFATNIITTMGLAVGIDYTLFIVSRFREELASGRSTTDAVAATYATAGRAVFFSGMTVVLALLGMLLVPSTLFTSLGAGAILVVGMAVIASLTLLPATLSLLGTRINALRIPYLAAKMGSPGFRARASVWGRLAGHVMRRPVTALVTGIVVLLTAASPIIDMNTGVSNVAGLPEGFEAKEAFAVLDRQFSGGMMNPIQIVVSGDADSESVTRGVDGLLATLSTDPAFGPPRVSASESGELTLVQTPVAGPSTGDLALQKVRELRENFIPTAFTDSGARVFVAGETARNLDYMDAVNASTPWVIGVVLALSFGLLLLAFRSLVIPAQAIVMNLLSVGAAYGLMTLVFEKGVGAGVFGFDRVDNVEQWVPLFLFSILFGLSMDYQVFLLSRIREEFAKTGDNRASVVRGVSSTAGLITGAALIMVAVFAGFASGQLAMFQQLGFGLGVAVLVDATIVRIVLVPASLRILGSANWYLPSWLDWVPRWNIEAADAPVRQSDDRDRDGGTRLPYPGRGGTTSLGTTSLGTPASESSAL